MQVIKELKNILINMKINNIKTFKKLMSFIYNNYKILFNRVLIKTVMKVNK